MWSPAALLLMIPLLFASDVSSPTSPVMSIRADRMQAHVNFLASDFLEGRGTATRGYDIAALYVANEFQKLGLGPGGDRQTFLQQIPFRKTDLVREQCSLKLIRSGKEVNFELEKDFLMYPDYASADLSISAPVVFAGFGVTAPDLKYDDFQNLNVDGKIIAIFSGAPQNFPGSERAHYSHSYLKEENAARHGAVGILTIRNPEDDKRSPWQRVVRQSKLSAFRWLDSKNQPNKTFPQIKGSAVLSTSGAEKLLRDGPVNLEALNRTYEAKQVKPFAIPVQVKMRKGSLLSQTSSPNVVAILSGKDERLKDEYLVYTAHLDHLGISEPVNGDSINNGAYDNAAGIASLIEIARAFTLDPPRRSILFAAVTAEEKGLQGSDYFANQPTVPVKSIVANINTDMFLMLYPFADAVAYGSEHSSLGQAAKEALRTVGLRMSPDPWPQEVIFIRSDQYPFIKKGIPAIMISSGLTSLDPSVKGMDAASNWLRTIYHSPQDDLTQKMNWESGVKIPRANYLLGFQVANSNARPSWNQGDFFGETFK